LYASDPLPDPAGGTAAVAAPVQQGGSDAAQSSPSPDPVENQAGTATEEPVPPYGFPQAGGHPHGWDGHDHPFGSRIHCKENADCIAFRDNYRRDPELAAQSLVKYLKGSPPQESKKFIARNYYSINKFLRRLDRNAPEISAATRQELSPFLDGVSPGHGKGAEWPQYKPDSGLPSDPEIGPGTEGAPALPAAPVPGGDAVPPQAPEAGSGPMLELMTVDRMLDSGDREAAATVLNTVRTNHPDDPGVQSAVSQYYNDIARDYDSQRNYEMAARNYEMAAQAATAAIRLDPENTEAYKNRAMARMSLRDRKGAIEDVRRAMELDPQDESSKLLSALVASKKSVTSLKSLSLLQEMRGSGGGDGVLARREGAFQSGDQVLEASLQNAPSAGQQPVDYVKSMSYAKTAASKNALRDYDAAVRYASMAILKNPGNTGAYLERASASNSLGRYEDAIRDTTDIINRDPSNVQALNMRAWALNRKGMAKEAESDVNRAIDINPGFADTWVNRALVYEKQGDYKRMLEDYRQAALLNGEYGGRFQDAVAQYSGKVTGFSYDPVPPAAAGGPGNGGMTRFLVLLGFTLTGGLLVALGLIHIFASSREKAAVAGRTPPLDVLAPSIFYEGVASGKYKIERKLGEGGMGIVYEALDQSLGRKVAIKKMNEEIKVNEREKRRFLEEARTLAMLHHPNIVEIHTIFEEGEDIYLVCEHVDGMSLEKLVEKEVRLPFERARAMFCEAAKALSYAHSKNVIHMDMKLSNIMISSDNEVKVMDFGLARRMKESLARVSSREVVGSPAYMPPEQDLGVSSKESDIYAMGICLYETLTGELPFKGPDFHYQKERMLYRPAGEVVAGLPQAVDAFIARALSPEPEKRFQSAAEFRRELMNI